MRGFVRSVWWKPFFRRVSSTIPRWFSQTTPTSKSKALDRLDIMTTASSYWVPFSINTALQLGIPELLHDKSALSIAELASKTGSDQRSLFRLMRALESVGFFHQCDNGKWENTESSTNVIPIKPLFYTAIDQLIPAWLKLTESVKLGKDGHRLASHSGGLSFWEYLQKNPSEGKIFNDAMTAMTSTQGPLILQNFPWEKFNGKTIVDIGGGQGSFLSQILLEKCPRSRGILLDLPTSGEGARKAIKSRKLEDRLEFVGGSFFEPLPQGDVIIVKHVLHNWNDEKSVEILKHCRKALEKSKGNLVLIDMFLADRGIQPLEGYMDLLMMALDGLERTRSEWKNILKQAEFEIARVTSIIPTATVIEAR